MLKASGAPTVLETKKMLKVKEITRWARSPLSSRTRHRLVARAMKMKEMKKMPRAIEIMS
jgi:hypothetical protein